MILGDLASIVQLGVGLHGGTALFQPVLDLAGTPMENRVSRLAQLAEAKTERDPKFQASWDAADDLRGDLAAIRVLFLRDFKRLVLINGGVAIGLLCLLAIIALDANETLDWRWGIPGIALSVGPAAISLVVLFRSWATKVTPIAERISALESDLLNIPKSA